MSEFNFDAGSFVREGQDRTAAQQTALMQVIAEQGAAGAQAYAQGQAQVGQAAQATGQTQAGNARGSAVAGSQQFAGEENSRMQAIQGLYQSDLAHGASTFGADIARQGATNSAYMGQVSAAIPIVASQVQSEAQALGEAANRIREKQAHDREMAAMEMQAMREAQAARREDRAAGKAGKYSDPRDARMADQEIAMNDRALAAGDPEAEKRRALESFASADSDYKQKLGPRARAAYDRLKAGESVDSIRRDKKLRDLNFNDIQDVLRRATEARRILAGFDIAV